MNPGDEVLVPAPYWVSYADMALLAGGVPKIIQTSEASGFRITAQQLAEALVFAYTGLRTEQSQVTPPGRATKRLN